MSLSTYNPIRPVRMYEEIIKQIEDMINSGEMLPGDKLPSERDLAQRLNVSRTTLAQALRVLEADGILVVRSGSGRFIRRSNQTEYSESVLGTLKREAIVDLLEVREVIEKKTVELACTRATEEDLQEIEKWVVKNGNYTADISFHISIAQASHNDVFYNIMKSSMNLLYNTREYSLLRSRSLDDIHGEHFEIFDAIRMRDQERASAKIARHIHLIKSHLNLTK
ncbi:MAG: FadR family transcriptional regulator [Chloroflexi bacterium]|nr:FadR family transcriptional regulator [Chloroflexota bacterium]